MSAILLMGGPLLLHIGTAGREQVSWAAGLGGQAHQPGVGLQPQNGARLFAPRRLAALSIPQRPGRLTAHRDWLADRFRQHRGNCGLRLQPGARDRNVEFLVLYFFGLLASDAGTYFKHRNDPGYQCLGASEAILAVLFASIVYFPAASIFILPIPIPVPILHPCSRSPTSPTATTLRGRAAGESTTTPTS